MKPIVTYLKFFTDKRKLFSFFGSHVIFLAAFLLAACLIIVVFQGSISRFLPSIQILIRVLFFLSYVISLSNFLVSHISKEQKEYLYYLGFSERQIRYLIRVVALPASFAGVVFFYIVLGEGLSWGTRLVSVVAMCFLGDLFCFTFLQLKTIWAKNKGNMQKKKMLKSKRISRIFNSPYRAFFWKDLKELGVLNIIVVAAAFFLLCLILMWFAGMVPFLQVYVVCLYSVVILVIGVSVLSLYQYESKAYHYYRSQLCLNDNQIVYYKLTLQALIMIAVTCVCFLSHGLMFGFVLNNLFVAFIVMIYGFLFCIFLNWWCIHLLQKNRIGSPFNLLFLVAFMIPGLAIAYILVAVFLLPKRTKDYA